MGAKAGKGGLQDAIGIMAGRAGWLGHILTNRGTFVSIAVNNS